MKLYFSPGACSLAPHIVLREVAAEFTLERVDTSTHTTQGGVDYYTINPKGYVPLLELDDGERLSEGPVITQYIADQAGRTDLAPAPGTRARYRVMEWQNYITSELHKSYSPLFKKSFDVAAKEIFAAFLKEKFAWVSTQLQGRKFLTGDSFTIADAYLYTVTNWATHVSLDLSGFDELQAFQRRVADKPSVQAALQAEGLRKA